MRRFLFVLTALLALGAIAAGAVGATGAVALTPVASRAALAGGAVVLVLLLVGRVVRRRSVRRSTERACAALAAACTDDLELNDATAGVRLALSGQPCRWDVHVALRSGYHLVTRDNHRLVRHLWAAACTQRATELRPVPSSFRPPAAS